MATVRVVFEKCIQDSQEYGSTDEMMVSRVFFTIEVKGKTASKATVHRFNRINANLKQAVGGAFEQSPIEVEFPCDSAGNPYAGPLDYQRFRNAAEGYYRSLVGSMGTGIHIQGGWNIRMYGNLLVKQDSVEFEADA